MYTTSDTISRHSFFILFSLGVIHFALGVSFKNPIDRSFCLAIGEIPPARKWFLGQTPRTKRIALCEKAWHTVPETDIKMCKIHSCLQPLVPLERDYVKIDNYNMQTLPNVLLLSFMFAKALGNDWSPKSPHKPVRAIMNTFCLLDGWLKTKCNLTACKLLLFTISYVHLRVPS